MSQFPDTFTVQVHISHEVFSTLSTTKENGEKWEKKRQRKIDGLGREKETHRWQGKQVSSQTFLFFRVMREKGEIRTKSKVKRESLSSEFSWNLGLLLIPIYDFTL